MSTKLLKQIIKRYGDTHHVDVVVRLGSCLLTSQFEESVRLLEMAVADIKDLGYECELEMKVEVQS